MCLDDQIGAGIQVTPNATRLLQRWGVLDLLSDSWIRPESCTVHRYSDGKVLAHEDDYCANMTRKYNAPFLDMYRADLQAAMVAKATKLGVQFKLNSKADSIDFDSGNVITASGSVYHGDLIIGADGLWSRCRESFLGTNDEPQATGDLAFRLLIKRDEVDDPEMRKWIETPRLHFWIGPGAHVVAYPIKGGQMYNLVLLVPDNLPPGVSKQTGTIEEMGALLENWDPL
jgi:salicylate hydroxylase